MTVVTSHVYVEEKVATLLLMLNGMTKDGTQIGGTTKEEQTLTLSNVGKTDSGTYTCVAQSHKLAKNETSIEIIVNCKHITS